MIDQASVVAAQHRGNRQPLQAAVLGQNSKINSFTALRALQLLQESDAAEMAQQARQPTESPSLLQEALSPPPNMMANQGVQFAGATHHAQSGGLVAMAPDQDYADGGIVAFANQGSVYLDEQNPNLNAAAYGGNTPEALALDELRIEERLKKEKLKKDREIYKYNLKYAPETAAKMLRENPLLAIDPAASAPPSATALAASGAPAPAPAPAPPSATALAASSAASGAPAPAPAPAPASAPADSSVMTPEAWAKGLDRQTGANVEDAGVPRSTGLAGLAGGALDALRNFKPTDVPMPKPLTRDEEMEAFRAGKKDAEELRGEDLYSKKARSILDKRLKDLEDPTRNSFDQALAWFKGAAAFQKGSRALPAMAEAFGEVASGYSAIKKEDRKARELVEAAELDLAKINQAREDGNTDLGVRLAKERQDKLIKAAEAERDIAHKKDTLRATVLGHAAQAETSAQGHLFTYKSNMARIAMDREIKSLAEQNRIDSTYLARWQVQQDKHARVLARVEKAKKDNTSYQRLLQTYNSLSMAENPDQGMMQRTKASIERIEKEQGWANQIKDSEDLLETIGNQILNKSSIKTPAASSKNKGSVDNTNPLLANS